MGLECPTKLFYAAKEEYKNTNEENAFLKALAKGSFQIKELAKLYYPGGQGVDKFNHEIALKETSELLKQDECIIYDAAIKHENFLVRIDILLKEGNKIKFLKVTSKSIDEKLHQSIRNNTTKRLSQLKTYFYEVAFQNYVIKEALSDYVVIPFMIFINKEAVCPTDGLSQKIKISSDNNGNRYKVSSETLNKEELTEKMLLEIDVSVKCHEIMSVTTFSYLGEKIDFSKWIKVLSYHYNHDEIIESKISQVCKYCEFKANKCEIEKGMRSGYHQCFKRELKWQDKDFEEDTVFDIWAFRGMKSFIKQNKVKMSDLTKEDLSVVSDGKPGLSTSERQWLQIEKVKKNDSSYYIDKENLKKEMEKWTYPLHFIDFETASPAIPFNKGGKPYEGVAFQFSHHVVHDNGDVEHKSQFINIEKGVNPNLNFVRKLKEVLSHDNGTIFRYATHENTYLNLIHDQLRADEAYIEDREELCQFIRTITEYKDKGNKQEGPRNMIDLCKLVKRYYYDPLMKGSNSIKVVLPSILNSSNYIKQKYSKPIYGTENGIKSLNFKNQTWVKFKDEEVIDPYSLLEKLFKDVSDKELENIGLHDELNNGGAAMVAYERLQFEDISEQVKQEIIDGLLRYCELDTLAMVMIYEAWVDMIK